MSKADHRVELFDGAPVWKPNYLFVEAPKEFCVAWDHRETHELGVIADTWTSADKQKIKKYRADINALESFETILSYTKVMSSSKDTVGLSGNAQILEIKNSDDEGSSNKVTKKRKLRRLVKASDAGVKSKKKKPPTVEEMEKLTKEEALVEKEGRIDDAVDPSKTAPSTAKETEGNPIPEAIPVIERHPEWFRPLEASLEKKNTVEDTDGSSTYTGAATIYHFGDTRIECPIIEEVAATLTEEESLKMLTTAMASILMREKKLKQEIASLQLEKGLLEQEKLALEESRKEEQAMRLAKEEELATIQAMYRESEAKLTEYRDNDAKVLGGHGVAVAALERMESGRTINAGWLQQFIRPHPKKTLHEAIKNGLHQLSGGQLPLFGPLCNVVAQMGSSTDIASFEGDALTVLPADAGEEVRVPELAPDFIGVDVEWEEDSSKQVKGDGQNDQESKKEGTSAPTPVEETNESQPSQPPGQNDDAYFIHLVRLLILEEDEVARFPMYAMISSMLRKFGDVHNTDIVKALEKELTDAVNALNLRAHSRLVHCFSQQEGEWKRRLHQYDLDFHDSLPLEANINEEMEKLKKENARLRKRENIVVSPWFLEKFDTLALVEAKIKVRTECFIAAIDLLKKTTKEVEFYSKQATVLQNILVDSEISLPILEDLDPDDEAKERAAAEEYLLRIND
ncbi:OLC1v1030962C1 [Oldenlandia corymbosa var. corymbosa]|uniref:OLC1v1030962C1 n=1 Tax=Oldenlandia corymbosa var. corymbosa TaxID=529605 RepID=A0AAV1CI65_OLDCO|nr:OLC1v1030962C1 [Oldenlandia corymbosa var. corymbosa]